MDAEDLLKLQGALIAGSLTDVEDSALLHGLCERLVALGVPLRRVTAGLEELHPTVEGQYIEWLRDQADTSTKIVDRAEWVEREEEWQRSPFYRLLVERETRLRRRRGVDYRQGEFSKVDELFAAGDRDYIAFCIPFADAHRTTDTDSLFSSWTTDRAEGFADAEVEAFDRLVPTLALALRARSLARSVRNVLTTYLGPDPGQRVLRGQIERGVAQRLDAVLWFSDLAGFTRIADTTAPDQIVPLLNDYAECQVAAIHAHGGQVLKFIGDGLLAIFPIDGDAAAACGRALEAAAAAYAGLDKLNRRRAELGLATTKFYTALHVGEVLYGNIGSRERLDFTVVGPAVNEVSRIEALSRSIDRDVILSAAFARAAAAAGVRLASLGRFALRGVARPQELFTLDPAMEQEGRP